MAFDFLKLPREAQKAAFAHMGARKHDRGRISGFVGVLPDKPAPGGRGRMAGKLPNPDTAGGSLSGKLRGQPKRRQLGSGARHRQLSASTKADVAEPKSGRTSPAQQRIDEMSAAYEKGHTRDGALTGGISASIVEKVKLSDGRTVVHKRQTPEETRREYLAGRVANALGVEDITVAQVSDRDILMNFVDGEPGAKRFLAAASGQFGDVKKRAAYKAEEKRQLQLRNAREIGMLDWLTHNDDRHALNWMVSPDGNSVIPIDHGRARFEAPLIGGKQHMVPNSPFITEWIRPDMDRRAFKSADPQWTDAELAKIRTSLDELKPEFRGPQESEWFDAMMTRFDLLEAA